MLLLRVEMKWTATMAARKPSTRPLHSPTCKQPQLRLGPTSPVTLPAGDGHTASKPYCFQDELKSLQQELQSGHNTRGLSQVIDSCVMGFAESILWCPHALLGTLSAMSGAVHQVGLVSLRTLPWLCWACIGDAEICNVTSY